MSLEDQVVGLTAGQAEQAVALQAIQTTLTAIQTTLAGQAPAGATAGAAPEPVDLTALAASLATIQATLNTITADVTEVLAQFQATSDADNTLNYIKLGAVAELEPQGNLEPSNTTLAPHPDLAQ